MNAPSFFQLSNVKFCGFLALRLRFFLNSHKWKCYFQVQDEHYILPFFGCLKIWVPSWFSCCAVDIKFQQSDFEETLNCSQKMFTGGITLRKCAQFWVTLHLEKHPALKIKSVLDSLNKMNFTSTYRSSVL